MVRLSLPSNVFACLILSCVLNANLFSQDLSRHQADSQIEGASTNTNEAKSKKFANQFWYYLLSNNYKHWSPVPGKTAAHFADPDFSGRKLSDQSPHGELLKSYMNRTAASDPNSLPIGSVIVLENYRPDKSLRSISVMYKTAGFNPQANDWYWVNFNADGSVSSSENNPDPIDEPIMLDADGVEQTFTAAPKKVRTAPVKLMGRAPSCIACHQQSGGNDLVFFNDDPTGNENMAKTSTLDENEPGISEVRKFPTQKTENARLAPSSLSR